jgi:N12 class adenine-specific DNA methylase
VAARRTVLNAHYTSAPVVAEMWRAATGLGFTAGPVLEPGCGSGNFIGFAPPGAEITGVELDPTTAEIARHLYGARATIHTSGFEDLPLPDGSFDLVIGNVPFAKVTPHDPRHNRGRHSLHNYFLLRSLALTRPGGLVVALTSRYTLDARNPAARHEIAGLADLAGAVRLPARAFAASSGTDVICDLLVLRRRPAGAPPAGPAWARTEPANVDHPADGEPIALNEYFAARPDRIAGRLTVARGMYRDVELTVEATDPLEQLLPAILDDLIVEATRDGLTLIPPSAPNRAATTAVTAEPGQYDTLHAQEGSFVVDPGTGRVARIALGSPVPYRPRVARDTGELVRLVGLRDATRAVLATQLDGGDDDALTTSQAVLEERYAGYRRLYGTINRSTQARTGRTDPTTGEDVLRRVRPRMGGFRDDPDWHLVAALEVFDETSQQAERAAIFTQRIIDPPRARSGVDTPAEAVAVCLDETGTVTLARAAQLLGATEPDALTALGDLVYDDPDTGALVPAPQYLSGNVRTKLHAARQAAAGDPRYATNAAALEAAMPRQLEPGEITARPGASWIPAADVEAFCRDVLGAGVDVEHLATVGQWTARLREGQRASVALSSEWGTARADAITLLDASLNQRLHTVTDPTDEGRRTRNDAETLAARDKQELLANRFSTWIWEDPDRATRLAGRYNELFSSHALATYDGSHLTLPGLAGTFHPRTHQLDAVARILTDGRALLAHAVGAGKTATMVIAAMEQRRLGHAAKPAVVVPNHMLEQFSREWLQLYPLARILVADREHLSRDRRKEFVARAATGDWDGIVFSQSGFVRLPLGRDLLRDYLGEEIARARIALDASHDGKGLSVKKMERRIAQLEETHKRLVNETGKDDGVRFEETGIDYLYVDEAHGYKNRRVDSSIDGVAKPGSQRAQDLDSKLWALRRHHGPRVATFATATPVANGMIELWVMETYLHPDALDATGLATCDGWAATFGRTHTALELAPDGASYRMQTRFARFQNVPELLGLYRQVADVRTAADLDLPTPALAGGKAETIVVPPSDTLKGYIADLAARAERIRSRSVDPAEDNMLKVTGDGRRAALDLRLVGLATEPGTGKVAEAAQRIAEIHHATRDHTYADATGQLALRSGALQLVFCDVSTPAATGWNAYDDLRDQLAQRGVPRDAIRFIQDAKTDQAKAALFAACRDGTVAVLVGSTETMGVGTNVQARAIALHHLDAPWRPADIEQRDGRIMRQGNGNPEVRILRYVTEGSFDTYMWQTLERKAAFIGQVTRGDLPDRDVDDVGDQTLTFAEVKALATGDPLILEKATVDADVVRLARLEKAHHDDQARLRRTIERLTGQLASLTDRSDRLHAAHDSIVDTRGDRFRMDHAGGPTSLTRTEAGDRIRTDLDEAARRSTTPVSLGIVGGLRVDGSVDNLTGEIVCHVPQLDASVRWSADTWATTEPANLARRIERVIQQVPSDLEAVAAEMDAARSEIARAQTRLGSPFSGAPELAARRQRAREIDDTLLPTESGPSPDPSRASIVSQSTDSRGPSVL